MGLKILFSSKYPFRIARVSTIHLGSITKAHVPNLIQKKYFNPFSQFINVYGVMYWINPQMIIILSVNGLKTCLRFKSFVFKE